MFEWLDGADVPMAERKVKQGAPFVTHRYRRLEFEIVDTVGKMGYPDSFVTDLPVNAGNAAELAACGRSRWRIETESFNTLKTKGCNHEHNFGHRKDNLPAVLATMNQIAFAMHAVADLIDVAWKAARAAVGTRKRCFEALRAITTCLVSQSWSVLVETPTAAKPPPSMPRG